MAATTITTNKRRHDRSAAPAPEHRYLVCLRNHRHPPLLWLTQEARADKKTALDVVRSDEGDRFTPPGGETVFISGPTKTPGFTLEHAAYRDDVVYGLVRVDVVYGLVRVDARSLLPDGDSCRWIVREPNMFVNFVIGRPFKTAWSELEPALAEAPVCATIVADCMPTLTASVVVDGDEVPDLNMYITPGQALRIIAPCSGGKTWRLLDWISTMQQTYPDDFTFMSVGVRITHCVDQHTAMERAGIECELYSDRNGERGRGIVVQLQSILKYAAVPDYSAVVLDEVCSLLSYFVVGNNGMFKALDGRRSMLPYLKEIERRCRGAKYLIMSDADILMDEKVALFMNGVCKGRVVNTLEVRAQKPFIKRQIRARYTGGGSKQDVEFIPELLAAIEGVLADPDERIFIACNAAKLATQENRAKIAGKDMGPSYRDFLVQHGIDADDILVVHGEVGRGEKMDYFKNLTEILRNKKALICTTAVTVGIDIEVPFGHIFGHTNHMCGTVRDWWQLLPRVGRFEGGLMVSADVMVPLNWASGQAIEVKAPAGDMVSVAAPDGAAAGQMARVKVPNLIAHVAVHSQSAEKRRADRNSVAAAAAAPSAAASNRHALAAGADATATREKYNKKATGSRLVDTMPDWATKIEAANVAEKSLSEGSHAEEFLRYAAHRGCTVMPHAGQAPERGSDALEVGEAGWEHAIEGVSRVERVCKVLAETEDTDDFVATTGYIAALQAGSSDSDDALTTSLHVVVRSVFWKTMYPYGFDPLTDANRPTDREIDLLYHGRDVRRRGVVVVLGLRVVRPRTRAARYRRVVGDHREQVVLAAGHEHVPAGEELARAGDKILQLRRRQQDLGRPTALAAADQHAAGAKHRRVVDVGELVQIQVRGGDVARVSAGQVVRVDALQEVPHDLLAGDARSIVRGRCRVVVRGGPDHAARHGTRRRRRRSHAVGEDDVEHLEVVLGGAVTLDAGPRRPDRARRHGQLRQHDDLVRRRRRVGGIHPEDRALPT